jgi:4-amino-4-deoxy-L-arabinose transferase-like glycosyltransferase
MTARADSRTLNFLGLAVFLALLTVVAVASRPLTPIDETRYVSVAWEMWLRGDPWVPFKNGVPYSDKPPLLLWLYQAGWAVFGVNDWWPRLVSPISSLTCLGLTAMLAQRLRPELPEVSITAPWILASSLLWILFSTSAMFDVLLTVWVLLGVSGIWLASQGKTVRGFALLGLAVGIGVLAKGPVILLHVLPLAVLAPWWSPGLNWKRWYGGIALAVLMGAAIALAWAIPAGFKGGEEFRHAIFWGQTANRMVDSFAHRRPFWWYLPLLPLLLYPWLVWPGKADQRLWLGKDDVAEHRKTRCHAAGCRVSQDRNKRKSGFM